MATHNFSYVHLYKTKDFTATVLVLVWILGVYVGISFYKSVHFPLIDDIISQPISVHGLLMVLFVPVIFAYFSIYSNTYGLLFLLVFFKAASFGFTGYSLLHCFGASSWLIRAFVQFSDYSCVLLLLYVMLTKSKSNFVFISFCSVFTAVIDYFIISPFLQGLF